MFSPDVIFPDAAAAVIAHLDDVLDVPVSRTVPNPRPASFVTVLRTGGAAADAAVVDGAQLTFEAWASDHPSAHDLAQLVRAHVRAMAGQVIDGTAVYRVEEFSGPQDLPDPESTQPRWTFTALVHVRGSHFDALAS